MDATDGLPLPCSTDKGETNAGIYARAARVLADYGDEGDRVAVMDYGGCHWSDEAALFNGLDPRTVQVFPVDARFGDRVADALQALNGRGRPKVWVFCMYDLPASMADAVQLPLPRIALAA